MVKLTHEMATDPSIDPVPKKDDPQTRRLHKLKPQSIPTGSALHIRHSEFLEWEVIRISVLGSLDLVIFSDCLRSRECIGASMARTLFAFTLDPTTLCPPPVIKAAVTHVQFKLDERRQLPRSAIPLHVAFSCDVLRT